MAKAPSISVVLPVYNGERYLQEAIDSVRSQSCVIAMQEEQPLYETLMGRLPAGIRHYAKWYNGFRRYPMYFHHMVRRLLAGDFENAMRVYRYVSTYRHTHLVALLWLFTANPNIYR